MIHRRDERRERGLSRLRNDTCSHSTRTDNGRVTTASVDQELWIHLRIAVILTGIAGRITPAPFEGEELQEVL